MRALLVGNGINRLSPSDQKISWEDVLDELADFAEMQQHERLKGKPFPLVFEAIFNHILGDKPEFKETELKELVSKLVGELPVNDYHRAFVRLPVRHILTTNYDDCLERAFGQPHVISPDTSQTDTSNYILNRSYKFKACSVWHIHGDQKFPNTLTLGDDHYAGYLKLIRDELLVPRQEKPDEQYWEKRLSRKKRIEKCERWIDVFLLADLDIIGLECDWSESVLWWLVQFRDKCQRLHETKHSISVGTVTFHDIHGPNPPSETHEARNQLLEWFGVRVKQYQDQDWSKSYGELISDLSLAESGSSRGNSAG